MGEGQGLQEKPLWIVWEGKRGYPKGSEGRTGGLGESSIEAKSNLEAGAAM